MRFKLYEEFTTERDQNINELQDTMNEGLFDQLFSWMGKIGQMFSNPEKVESSVEAAVTDMGDTAMKSLTPKKVAIKETYFVMMGDGKSTKTNFSLSMTKMADLPDGSGLFQITGTTNEDMLKSLTGTNVMDDLVKNNIMAIVSVSSVTKGKPITVKLLKNVMPKGKDYVSRFIVTGIAPGTSVEKTLNKNKTT